MLSRNRLTKLEKIVGQHQSGLRCPTCCCRGGESDTGRHLVFVKVGNRKPREIGGGEPWWTGDGCCPACGTQLGTVTVVIEGIGLEHMEF